MLPKITIGLVVVVIIAYIAGAKWPGLANRVGIA